MDGFCFGGAPAGAGGVRGRGWGSRSGRTGRVARGVPGRPPAAPAFAPGGEGGFRDFFFFKHHYVSNLKQNQAHDLRFIWSTQCGGPYTGKCTYGRTDGCTTCMTPPQTLDSVHEHTTAVCHSQHIHATANLVTLPQLVIHVELPFLFEATHAVA